MKFVTVFLLALAVYEYGSCTPSPHRETTQSFWEKAFHRGNLEKAREGSAAVVIVEKSEETDPLNVQYKIRSMEVVDQDGYYYDPETGQYKFSALRKLIYEAKKKLRELEDEVSTGIHGGAEEIRTLANEAGKLAGSAYKTAENKIENGLHNAVNEAVEIVDNEADVIKTAYNAVDHEVEAGITAFKNKTSEVLETAAAKFTDAYTAVTDGMASEINTIQNETSAVVETVKTEMGDAYDAVADEVTSVINTVKNKTSEAVVTVEDGVKEAYNKVADAATTELNTVKEEAKDLGQGAEDFINQAINGTEVYVANLEASFMKYFHVGGTVIIILFLLGVFLVGLKLCLYARVFYNGLQEDLHSRAATISTGGK